LLFLVNKLSKMKNNTSLGSRIAEVHNGSSLFTGDAGQGESNIRRWIIENDWLEAIVALPENMFYNTGIATYIWLLSNRKSPERKGKTQLINASNLYVPLRKNLGKKNCEFSEEQISKITDLIVNPVETEESKIFPNEAFGYYKVTVERPLKLKDIEPDKAYSSKEIKELISAGKVDENGVPVIKKIHKQDRPDPLNGLFERTITGKKVIVEYEPDSSLRDTEQIPLLEPGGIEAFFNREVLTYVPGAWIDDSKTQIGYEISFTKYFYRPVQMRTLEEIVADIQKIESETDGLLKDIIET
jgi:type I restriction enzyme M protein